MPPDEPMFRVPIPDPTALTDAAIAKAMEAMRDYVDGQFQVRDVRLGSLEMNVARHRDHIDTWLPTRIDEKVANHVMVAEEKFKSIDMQFAEREASVKIALAAQKDSVSLQNAANEKAIGKSEVATTDAIRTNLDLFRAAEAALTKSLDEAKQRITIIEAMRVGGKEDRSGLYAALAAAGALISIIVVIAGLIVSRGVV